MICLDANVFLRAIVPPTSDRTRREQHQAEALFQAAGTGDVILTASDVAIHEVLYILTLQPTKNGYGLAPADACDRLHALVVLPGFFHPRKPVLLTAFDLWRDHPRLGFSDAFTAALARSDGMQVLTFDADFDDLDDIERYQPAA